MKNAVTLTAAMSATQSQPIVQCGSVSLGAVSCTTPSAKAAAAAKA